MMTQTHLLVAAGVFARPGATLRNTAAICGALVPDLAIYTLFSWSKLAGIPERTVWRELYWQEPWQSLTAAGNSIPLYVLIAILAFFLLRSIQSTFRIGLFAMFFALAALSHIALDLPVHVEDAHRHFWPFSDWKFVSPVSYWNPNHHGGVMSIVEAELAIGLAIYLMFRFRSPIVRGILVLAIIAYVAVPAYFHFVLGGGSGN